MRDNPHNTNIKNQNMCQDLQKRVAELKLMASDLTKFSEDEVRKIISSILPQIPLFICDFEKGRIIERAVSNNSLENLHTNVERLSFKPADLNDKLQRASIINDTMFYGSVLFLGNKEINYERIIGSFEACGLLRENEDGDEIMSFGQWTVIDQISFVTIIDPLKKYKNEYLKTLQEQQNKYFSQSIKESSCLEIILDFHSFLADEFSKDVNKAENHNYLISSVTANIFKTHGYGVYYPSVQIMGEGMCVAIPPGMTSRIILEKILVCKISKRGKSIEISNQKIAILKDKTNEIIYFDVQ
ncbi:hypothetical protein [Sphingobacterium anhuiense]|uniref:Uncharacterized protein n=1 Tax=Sphingobacterium anhuiense TaxID=493780 RepID=A0ABW5YXD6_9SPHI